MRFEALNFVSAQRGSPSRTKDQVVEVSVGSCRHTTFPAELAKAALHFAHSEEDGEWLTCLLSTARQPHRGCSCGH